MTHVYEGAAGPNDWERRMLYLAEADSVLAACTVAAVESMRWTCDVAGHPKQHPDHARCICETWAGHVLAGTVEVVCRDHVDDENGDFS